MCLSDVDAGLKALFDQDIIDLVVVLSTAAMPCTSFGCLLMVKRVFPGACHRLMQRLLILIYQYQ